MTFKSPWLNPNEAAIMPASDHEPLRLPLPPQTRYDSPLGKWPARLMMASAGLPMAWALVAGEHGYRLIFDYGLTVVLAVLGIFINALAKPWFGIWCIRLLQTSSGGFESVCIFRPYCGRKSREYTGGTVELVELGEVTDLDAPYEVRTSKWGEGQYKQRWEPALFVFDF